MSNPTLSLVHLKMLSEKECGADRVIALYLLNHLEQISHLTLAFLAEETHTSYATVSRFFKKLDTGGFREFKKIIISEMDNAKSAIEHFHIESAEMVSFQQISRKIGGYAISVIENCCKTLDSQMFESLSGVFRNAKSLYFVGLGTSAVTAQYAYTKFFRIKAACAFDTDIILAKMKVSLMTKGHVLFVISSSGRTKSVLELAKIARENGAMVVSLSDYADSPLSRVADINLHTTARESNKYIDTDFPLIQGQITLIDILYACLYHDSREAASSNYNKTQMAIQKDKLHSLF